MRCLRLGLVAFEAAWERQRRLHADVLAGRAPNTLLTLQHPFVYTAGRRTMAHELPSDGTPVVAVDRGGKITWHGPGQLVGYPVLRLPERVYVVDYVRRLEAALVSVCADLGVPAGTVPGRTGVWTADGRRKLAAIGIRVAGGVTMHGFALNCDCDLEPFGRIVPCGIADAGVGSLTTETGRRVGVADAVAAVERRLTEGLEVPVVGAA